MIENKYLYIIIKQITIIRKLQLESLELCYSEFT